MPQISIDVTEYASKFRIKKLSTYFLREPKFENRCIKIPSGATCLQYEVLDGEISKFLKSGLLRSVYLFIGNGKLIIDAYMDADDFNRIPKKLVKHTKVRFSFRDPHLATLKDGTTKILQDTTIMLNDIKQSKQGFEIKQIPIYNL